MVEVFLKSEQELKYAKEGDSGVDVRALRYSNPDNLDKEREITGSGLILNPLERVLIRTGVKMALPSGYEVQVRPRSGMSLKHGIVATLGTIDSKYVGEQGVILINLSNKPYTIQRNERIAQLVCAKVETMSFTVVSELPKTERGESGFGSTGKQVRKDELEVGEKT